MLRRLFVGWVLGIAGVLAAPVALAEDLAVIIANELYDTYPRVRDGRPVRILDRDFQEAGFNVVVIRNMTSGMPEPQAADLWQRMSEAERLVVVLSGHFVRTGATNWLLTTDADRPSGFTVGAYGFPLSAVMEIAADKQGAAIVAVAVDGTEVERGPGTAAPSFSRNIPQGVTFIHGAQRPVADFIAGEVLQPGRILADAARVAPDGLRVEGFLPSSQPFLPRTTRRPDDAGDRAFWQRAQAANTLEAYLSYLDRYPEGLFAQEASARAEQLRLTPAELARLDEESLNLTRDQRRTIQRNLNLIGFETGGIDGIFGPRTRSGIAAWQRQIGISASGYLNANQISRIANSAAIRAAELEAEAERRRIETERRDRLYWDLTGAGSTVAGLREYLDRYPDGLYADVARTRLDDFEREQRRLAQQAEREAWDRAEMAGTLEAYSAYLTEYPQGRFAEEAQARVNRLSRPETPPEVVQAAKREEEALALNVLTRQLIEGQLNRLGLEPGPVDGRLDRETRRALRRYQRGNELPVTGFVTRDVIVRLLASAVQ